MQESTNAEREAKRLEREMKKQEAIERSKMRQQQQQDYFKQKAEMNKEGLAKTRDNAIVDGEEGAVDNIYISEEKPSEDCTDDPFRTFKPTRSKIFVK